jgi:hypothetical protein
MAAKRNFMLTHGERLAELVVVRSGAGDKVAPYTISESKLRLAPRIRAAVQSFDRLPAEACPGGRVVGTLTLNPEYIAKSYHPGELLKALGLEAVGSRPRKITPEKRSRERAPEPALTTELFVAGPREAFSRWGAQLPSWPEASRVAETLVTIEDVAAPDPHEKIKGQLPESRAAVFEVVLHADEIQGETLVVPAFQRYLRYLDLDPTLGRRFYSGGLCFLEMEGPVAQAEAIAAYTMVRVIRQMPVLRTLRPAIRGVTMPSEDVQLPPGGPVDQTTVAAIFDGGVPGDHAMTPWVNPIEPPGIGTPVPQFTEHGVSVTSAFLFGHLDPKTPAPTPYCRVDHYRVLDSAPGQNPHELYEVLGRIQAALARHSYPLINLSVGPILPVEDDDVHAWTSILDEHLANGQTLATFAVGNTGDQGPGHERIQVPSDCVNALAVGACDRQGAGWSRAHYSSIGPGRSPGLMKPDVVSFGGSMPRPFLVLGPGPGVTLQPTGGTSLAAPSVLRLGAGVRAHFGDGVSMLAIRALLVHSCEASDLPKHEVGRGRVGGELEPLVICADDEMRLVYQGQIAPGKYIRATIPVPGGGLVGMVQIRATLCFTTNVDPHHPGNYTQAGLEAIYRPNALKRSRDDQIHADTKSFFGPARKGLTEEELRRDAWKWENTHHGEVRCRGSNLHDPVFDIHYNAREEGHSLTGKEELNYALVVTVKAPRMGDLYDRVRRRYATILEPLQPIIDIPVRT